MKKLVLVLFVFFSGNSYVQSKDDVLKFEHFRVNRADSVKANPENQTLAFYGNVDFESEKLKFIANEVFLDKKTNTIRATGIQEMHFDGSVISSRESKNRVLKYTIGDSIVLIE